MMYRYRSEVITPKAAEVFGVICLMRADRHQGLMTKPVLIHRALDKIHDLIVAGKLNTQDDIERASEDEPAIRDAFQKV